MNLKTAVKEIERHGVLLVFPISNKKVPPSLWSAFYPRSPMRWEWDEAGDDRVAKLWHLREELSSSGKVVYTKWYQGRATLFSRQVFVNMLAALGSTRGVRGLGSDAFRVLEALEMESPLSTKQLKRATDLRGKAAESTYERALRELWARLLIVACGEVDEGAFPSLALGATRLVFEDLWTEAQTISVEKAETLLEKSLGKESSFLVWHRKALLKAKFAAGNVRPRVAENDQGFISGTRMK